MKRICKIVSSLVLSVTLCSISVSAADPVEVLSYVSTPLMNKMPNRTDNIILTCKMLNEAVLMPGSTFSFNQTVGNRVEDRGFKPAPTFVNGRVEESVGGGICQVSSTLYYACLKSNLEIVSRTSHSMSPDYLEKPGLDATVCWNAIDYQFKNDTNHPIKILTWVEDDKVHVKIMGTKTNHNTVVIESKIISTTPFQTIYRENPNLAPGQTKVVQVPFTGYVVETYRVITDENGNLISCKPVSKDTYKKLDQIIEQSPHSS